MAPTRIRSRRKSRRLTSAASLENGRRNVRRRTECSWDKSVRFAIARACGCEGEVPQGLREDVDEGDGAGSVRFGVIASDDSHTPPRSLVFQKGVRPLLVRRLGGVSPWHSNVLGQPLGGSSTNAASTCSLRCSRYSPPCCSSRCRRTH